MEYLKGKCTKCDKELQIPKDLERVICMYCGCEMAVEEAVNCGADTAAPKDEKLQLRIQELESQLKSTDNHEEKLKLAGSLLDIQNYNFAANNFFVEDRIPYIIDNEKPVKDIFKKNIYQENFEALFEQNREVLNKYTAAYQSFYADPKSYASQVADLIIGHAKDILAQHPKSKRKTKHYDISLFAALFVVPMIGYCHCEATDALADALVAGWRVNFKANQIQRGSYEDIAGGFKKKLCYITTAVCEHEGKPDNCYELASLRKFRDGWLMSEEDGPKLVEEYYDTAPYIVQWINQRPDKLEIYKQINMQYITPCMKYIEEGHNKACKALYKKMVEELMRKTVE